MACAVGNKWENLVQRGEFDSGDMSTFQALISCDSLVPQTTPLEVKDA